MLDHFDRQILDVLQRDALTPASNIGERVGLSASAVQRRIRRLRDDGIITRICAEVNPATIGWPVTCIVNVDLADERLDQIESFAAAMKSAPCVQQCYYTTGATDFVLVVIAKDMAHYDAFTRSMLLQHGNVKSFTTMVVMSSTKTSRLVPVANT